MLPALYLLLNYLGSAPPVTMNTHNKTKKLAYLNPKARNISLQNKENDPSQNKSLCSFIGARFLTSIQ